MWTLALLLLLQAAPPQREILGPFLSRDDQGQTTKVVLKNGLTVIVREEYAVPLASITTLVKTGYFDEEDRVSGIAHVLEHMYSAGTNRRGAGEILAETRSLGGVFTATTYDDRTVYGTVVPASNALEALEIQSDALLHPSFDADALKKEIEAILQENDRTLDNPAALASAKLYETAFVEHRLKRWKTGSAENLRALTREDVAGYYQKYYRPSNIILAIVGAFDREKVFEEVVRLYAGAENVPVERDPYPQEPAQDGLRYAWRRGPIQQSHVAMGFHAPGVLTEEARALEVLAAILGTGRSSRLNEVVRDRKSVITSGSAAFHGFREIGFFEVDLQTASPLEAATAALAEFENIKRFGVSEEIVARAKAAAAMDHFRKMETVGGVAESLAYFESLGDWKLLSGYLSHIQKVTPQRVVEAARRYLTPSSLSVFEYSPESAERYLSPAEYRAAVLDKVEASVERRNEQELPVAAVIPPERSTLVADTVGTIQRRSILRGPDVYILEDRRLPIVSFGILYPGGRLMETERNAGITDLMLRTALRGTRSFSGAELARRLENAGARIEVVNEPDFFGYMLNGLSSRMDLALQVLVDVLQNPLFEESEVLAERALQLARIPNLRDDGAGFSTNLFMEALFGDHPYARDPLGTESGISRLTGTQLREWFRDNQRKILPTIVIVGDTRGTALVAPIADALTNEDLQPRDVLTMPRASATTDGGPSVETTALRQSTMVYGFSGVNRSGNDRYALDLIAGLISGRGLAYTAQTTNISNARGGALFTRLEFSPDKETDVRAILDEEFAKIRQSRVSAAEFSSAAEYTIGSREAILQSRESRALDYARAIYSGLAVTSVARYDLSIRGVTLEQLKLAVERYLNPAALRTGIVRGEKR